MHVINYKPVDISDLVASVKPVVARMLPGRTEHEDPLRVDVHVRSYEDEAPLSVVMASEASQAGRLPVGSIVDYYA